MGISLGRGPRPEGVPLACDLCDRMTSPNAESAQWWLDALHPTTDVRVCRCPQHIDAWAFRTGGMARSKSNYRWARLARENDRPENDTDPWLLPGTWD